MRLCARLAWALMTNRAGANSKESCLDFLSDVRVILPTLSYRALSEEEEEERNLIVRNN